MKKSIYFAFVMLLFSTTLFAQKVDVSKLNTLRGEHSIIDFAIRQRIDRGH